jgi:hypothetical protein
MTTAAILESLADRGRFEHLATSVLRRAEPSYSAIIQTGVNVTWLSALADFGLILLRPSGKKGLGAII